jgi:two-component system cell cycle sensor histidine kinase/response regulator CckA
MPRRHPILIVEDERPVRSLCRKILEKSGFHVLEAEDARQARALLEAGQPISLLITDVRMPQVSGPHLVQELVPQRPDLRVLYISGSPNDIDLIEQHLCAGICKFLRKPFTPAELVGQVQTLLGSTEASSGSENPLR